MDLLARGLGLGDRERVADRTEPETRQHRELPRLETGCERVPDHLDGPVLARGPDPDDAPLTQVEQGRLQFVLGLLLVEHAHANRRLDTDGGFVEHRESRAPLMGGPDTEQTDRGSHQPGQQGQEQVVTGYLVGGHFRRGHSDPDGHRLEGAERAGVEPHHITLDGRITWRALADNALDRCGRCWKPDGRIHRADGHLPARTDDVPPPQRRRGILHAVDHAGLEHIGGVPLEHVGVGARRQRYVLAADTSGRGSHCGIDPFVVLGRAVPGDAQVFDRVVDVASRIRFVEDPEDPAAAHRILDHDGLGRLQTPVPAEGHVHRVGLDAGNVAGAVPATLDGTDEDRHRRDRYRQQRERHGRVAATPGA